MTDLGSLELLDREDLVRLVTTLVGGGVVLNFHGKRHAMEIAKRVRPRCTRRVTDLHVGPPHEQARNVLIEGENLQAMVTLYKYRGQIDLIVADPPYNTGQQFRYNDRWDSDPNDPDLGPLVSVEDGSRHTKWMKSIVPRLQLMKAMLKPQGVIAVCIDDNELFHLGMILNEIFGESNRLAIINWQKTTSKNDAGHVAKTTEYVLVYAKDADLAETGRLEATEKSKARFRNPDSDLKGRWKQGDATAREWREATSYAIQSPFTGELHRPDNRHWSNVKKQMKDWLEGWGSRYEEVNLDDGCSSALVLKGYTPNALPNVNARILQKARSAATKRLDAGNWPPLYFGLQGESKPMLKVYETDVRAGIVPPTFWSDDFEFEPDDIGCVAWDHSQTGRSREGTEELRRVLGTDAQFETIKPLKLIKKLVQLWCPPDGLVLDPYAGSGTTGHAVLELNKESGSSRRFILIEQGRPEEGDKYARTLTWTRLKRAITGERPGPDGKISKRADPLGGGFEFRALTNQIDARTVLTMKRDDLIDVVITSHWETNNRNAPTLIRIDDLKYKYLVGRNEQGNGYFIIWSGDGPVGKLDLDAYRQVLLEGRRENLVPPYHVYARYEVYQSSNVIFYKIPDKILAHLGLNESTDAFNNAASEQETTV